MKYFSIYIPDPKTNPAKPPTGAQKEEMDRFVGEAIARGEFLSGGGFLPLRQHGAVVRRTDGVAQVIDGYVTPDLVFHGWDLARASGQDPELDEDYIAGAYAGMTGMADMIRGSGQFGVQQDVPADASVVEKFFAFIGRDPRWTP